MIGRFLGDDPGSAEFFEVTRKWLKTCLDSESHDRCRLNLSSTKQIHPEDAPLPTRCIDVLGDKIVLVTFPEDVRERGSYITLSHRWMDETKKSQTMPENYESRSDPECGIEISTLPTVFQDAIEVARKLGIRYVWIDSLCIIQDGEDFLKEKDKMAQYYQNSVFTIAACGVNRNERTGLTRQRASTSFSNIAVLPYTRRDGTQGGVVYILKKRKAEFLFSREVEKSELISRGWVFQEWLLSRRIIYYSPTQVFFECLSSRPQTECEERVPTGNFKSKFVLKESNVLREWYRTASLFSALQLTAARDHVWAISGVALEFRRALDRRPGADDNPVDDLLKPVEGEGDEYEVLEYVSGLWLRDLPYGLLWQRAASKHPRHCILAPNWSWQSILGRVEWPRREPKLKSEIVVRKLEYRNYQVADFEVEDAKGKGKAPDRGPAPKLASIEVYKSEDSGVFYLPSFRSGVRLDVNSVCGQLVVQTKVIALEVAGRLSPTLIEQVSVATGISKPKDGEYVRWVGLSLPGGNSEHVVAWGSFEHKVERGETLFAVLVASYEEGNGLAFGFTRTNRPIFCVVFCRMRGPSEYSRVGVGRVFDVNAVQRFQGTEVKTVKLI